MKADATLHPHFSSRTDEWSTPADFFERLNKKFAFTLDPCSTHENAKCEKHFTKAEDGLSKDWGKETVFMNPPYGRAIGRWMEKALRASRNGATVVCLVPARTDTNWWDRFAVKGEVTFIRGRLQFGDAKHPAPFPSALVVFRPAAPRSSKRKSPREEGQLTLHL